MNWCADTEFPCSLLTEAAPSSTNISVFHLLWKRGKGFPVVLSLETYTNLTWSIPLFSSCIKQDAPKLIHFSIFCEHALEGTTTAWGYVFHERTLLDTFPCTTFSQVNSPWGKKIQTMPILFHMRHAGVKQDLWIPSMYFLRFPKCWDQTLLPCLYSLCISSLRRFWGSMKLYSVLLPCALAHQLSCWEIHVSGLTFSDFFSNGLSYASKVFLSGSVFSRHVFT